MMPGQDSIDGSDPRPGRLVQIVTSVLLNILAFGTGASYGIPNVILTQLDPKVCDRNATSTIAMKQSYDVLLNQSMHYCPFTISSEQKVLVANSATIGLYFTVLFAVTTVSRFGKRVSLMIDCILSLIGFGLMASAVNVPMLYLAKFLLGYASLTSRASIQPFISEICTPALRGVTISFYVVFYIMGQGLSILAANHFVKGGRYVSVVLGVLMIICFLALLLWVHESPDWLLEKCRFDEATRSLEFYQMDRKILIDDDEKRKTMTGEDKSYEEIVAMYQEEASQTKKSAKNHAKSLVVKIKEKSSSVVTKFKQPEVYKPFYLLTAILGLLELSGFAVMANFSIVLMEEYGYEEHKTFMNASDIMAIIYLCRIPISFLAMPLLKKVQKRPLYLVVSTVLLIILIGIIVFTNHVQSITKQEFQQSIGLQIIPLILFILFYSTFSFGSGNIPFGLMGELFPPNASTMANTFVFILSNILGFIAIQTALAISETHGLLYVFVMPAGAVAASILIAGIFMPETQGLSLDEIRKIYGKSDVQLEEKVPYYHRLRSGLQVELKKKIKQRQSVYILSPEVSPGAIE